MARTRDLVISMITTPAGGFLASAPWSASRPLSSLGRYDFYGRDGSVVDEAAFIARVIETTEHRRDLHYLGRVQARISCSTPWGMSRMATI